MQRNQLAHPLYSVARFEGLFGALGWPHDNVCGLGAGALDTPPAFSAEAMDGWLEDIVCAAQETGAELRAYALAAHGSRRKLSG